MTHSGVARARHCRASYCNKDIANEIHIACADPACANFELCLQVSVRLPKKKYNIAQKKNLMIRSLSASLCKSTTALNHRNLPLFACSYSVCVVSCRRYLISLLRLSFRIIEYMLICRLPRTCCWTQCFSVGLEEGTHENTHNYRVIDNMKFPLFHPDWGADEEMRLLTAMEASVNSFKNSP